jgi:integrase
VVSKSRQKRTASAAGSRFVETMLTVIETCRQQGRNVFSFRTAAVEAHLAHQPAPSLLPRAWTVTREEATPLHPVAAEHLRAIFDPEDRKGRVFAWDHSKEKLYAEFRRIQRAAGIEVSCSQDHQHTPGCRFYAFHALRRGFASENVDNLPAEALQKLMRHTSYATTQRYINMARRRKGITERLAVPESARMGGMRERVRESQKTAESASDETT